MIKLKSTFVSLFVISLAGCIPIPSFMMKNSIEFVAGPEQSDISFVFKNTWPECSYPKIDPKMKYITYNSGCKLKEGYIPEEIVIEYAPWLTYAQQQEIPELRARDVDPKEALFGDGQKEAISYNKTTLVINIEKAIDKLPPTAWKKIVLHPAELVKKYRFQTPPLPKSGGNRSRGKEIHYIITLNPDGTYNVEDKLYWVDPYVENWN